MLNRRSLLRSAIAATALAPLSGLAGRPAWAADTELRLYWWGSQDRANRTLAVADLFAKSHPGITATGEPVGADYWPKLATMMVGGSLPDVIQFEPTTLPDYSRRGAALPLDEFISSGVIREDRFAPGVDKLCVVDGKAFGVALGLNSFCMLYDAEVFEKAGIAPPTWGTTWDEIGELAIEVGKAAGRRNFWGMVNGARYNYVFDVWLHQRGKMLFTAEGQFGFDVEDARAWYAYWDKLNKAGATVAADVQSGDTHQLDTNPLTKGNAAMAFNFSNQFTAYQKTLPQKLGMTTLPIEEAGGPSGLYFRPALIWSIGKTTKHAEDAAKFIDFFVNDIEAGKILGVDRGVPVNLDVRAAVAPGLTDAERVSVDYIDFIADKVTSYPPPTPVGATEFDTNVMRPVADQLLFGTITVDEAAAKMIADGKRVMKM